MNRFIVVCFRLVFSSRDPPSATQLPHNIIHIVETNLVVSALNDLKELFSR